MSVKREILKSLGNSIMHVSKKIETKMSDNPKEIGKWSSILRDLTESYELMSECSEEIVDQAIIDGKLDVVP
jgi:hypothetical protein